MGARQFGAVVLAAMCLAAVVGTATAGNAGGPSARTESQQVTPNTVVMRIFVHGNGTASWEVVYRTRLDDPETAAAFRSYRDDVRNNSSAYSGQFADRMADPIRSAERATGREMASRDFDVRAEIREFPQRYGVVVYSFRWVGFAAVEDDRMRIGDALSGMFLNGETRLLVSWPEGYEAVAVRPTPDEPDREGTAVWTGPTDFAGNEPRIVLRTPGAGRPEVPWTGVAVALGVAGLLAAGLAAGMRLYRSRERTTSEGDGPPEDLLSNEERVLRLLERQGGRVKQKAVVEKLDWTEAKTSQVVGSLREQGEIESFRLGRENVLALPAERRES